CVVIAQQTSARLGTLASARFPSKSDSDTARSPDERNDTHFPPNSRNAIRSSRRSVMRTESNGAVGALLALSRAAAPVGDFAANDTPTPRKSSTPVSTRWFVSGAVYI